MLKQWARAKIGRNKLHMVAAKMLIAILETVQAARQLSDEEIVLKKGLKQKLLGFAAVEKLRARQQSRITWIRACDAASKFFFLSVNGRRRKKHIQCLHTHGQFYTHQQKAHAIYHHFSSVLGSHRRRQQSLNWERLGLARHDLQHLEAEFTEEEVRSAITDMANEKALGPDGYIGAFFKSSWVIIKEDVMRAITLFFNQHSHHLKLAKFRAHCSSTKACRSQGYRGL